MNDRTNSPQAAVYDRAGTQAQFETEPSGQINRVYALYRVSTLGQVEKDDIPMQRQCCHEFAGRQGWNIIREFSEKGVSGYKVSAKDRDAIREIQRDALAGRFDILLVLCLTVLAGAMTRHLLSWNGS